VSKYIEKPWGLMKKVDLDGGKSDCWLGFMRENGATSVHRHSCDSVVCCVSGQILITFFGDGDEPDYGIQHSEWLYEGNAILVRASDWHSVRFMDGREFNTREAIFHEWYDLDKDQDDYPIDRYEEAKS
jgi:hypothetical protein